MEGSSLTALCQSADQLVLIFHQQAVQPMKLPVRPKLVRNSRVAQPRSFGRSDSFIESWTHRTAITPLPSLFFSFLFFLVRL